MIVTISLLILTIANIGFILSKEQAVYNNPDHSKFGGTCEGLSYYGANAEKDKEKCLKSIERDREKAIAAEEYLANYKGIHLFAAIVYPIVAIISLIVGLPKRKQKVGYILLSILILVLNALFFIIYM